MQAGQTYNPYRLFIGLFIPNWIAQMENLSPLAKLCFGRLAQYMGKDGECYPTITQMTAELGSPRRNIFRAIQELEDQKLIQRIAGRTNGKQAANRYEFLWHQAAETEIAQGAKKQGAKLAPCAFQGAKTDDFQGANLAHHIVVKENQTARESDVKVNTFPPVPVLAPAGPLPPPDSGIEKQREKPPHTAFVDSFKSAYERMTGHPYAYRKEEFIMVAAKVREFGIDAVNKKAIILAQMCETKRMWFTADGWPDFTISKLVKFWNNILPEGKTQKEIEQELSKKRLEDFHARIAAATNGR